jgi:CheY-like chemotaxis protein
MTIKLLILEDLKKQQQYFLDFYKDEIETGTYELIFTQTGEEALEIINNDRQREIDLIIADLKLPAAKIDGWQFIKTLSKSSIDIKIIVITAWGKLENFSEQERKNIIYFIKRNTEEDDLELLKERIELVLEIPDHFTTESKKVRFNTLLKAAKDLPSKQKFKLINKLLGYLDLKELKAIEKQFPSWIENYRNAAIERDRVRKWLIEKEKTGELKFQIPVSELDYFYLDIKPRDRSTYCDVRYWHEGRLCSAYVPVSLVSELLQIIRPH